MNAPWRVGRKLGRTLYVRKYTDGPSDEDHFVGIMDTPEDAARVVAAVNAVARVHELHTPERSGPDNTPYCRTCGTMTPCPTIRALGGQ